MTWSNFWTFWIVHVFAWLCLLAIPGYGYETYIAVMLYTSVWIIIDEIKKFK